MKDKLLVLGKKAYITSRELSELLNKEHKNVLRDIKFILENSNLSVLNSKGVEDYFVKRAYQTGTQKRNYTEYLLTKDGFILYMFNIQGYNEFKVEYIEKFNKMEEYIRSLEISSIYKSNTEWLLTRKQGKLVRRNETDCLAEFIIYAREQGSKTPEKYYINFSKLVNKQVGIGKDMRDKVSITTLNHIANLENLIINTVKENMLNKVYYKDIYQICKKKCEQYKDLLQLEKIECKLIS